MKRANVALIDDEKHIADFYSKIIRDTFFKEAEVFTFYYSEDLLASQISFDLIVCDIDRPAIDGIELAKRRREKGKTEIIFLTGRNDFSHSYQALQIPNVSYILKIDAADKLANAVREKLSQINEKWELRSYYRNIENENQKLQEEKITKELKKVLDGNEVEKGVRFDDSYLFLAKLFTSKEDNTSLLRDSFSLRTGEILRLEDDLYFFLKNSLEPSFYEKALVSRNAIYQSTKDRCRLVYFDHKVKREDFASVYGRLKEYLLSHSENGNRVSVFRLSDDRDEFTQRDNDNRFLNEIHEFVLEERERDASLNSIAKHFNYNPSYLSRLFKAKYNQNIKDYIISIKLKKAKQLLKETDLLTKEIAQKLGFYSMSHFFRVFKKEFSRSPNEFRELSRRK